MKNILVYILFITISVSANSQNKRVNHHSHSFESTSDFSQEASRYVVNDSSFDVGFYHLDVEVAIDSAFIKGVVKYGLTASESGLNHIKLDLDSTFSVDSVWGAGTNFLFAGNVLTIYLTNTYNQGDTFSLFVSYQGVPLLAGGYKGLRYETHNGNEPVIATLSTPYLAHTWWPCKDGITDKADSVFVDITVKDTVVNTIPLIAVSNGILKNVVDNGATKTFSWEHRYPIVPYYVMLAISNYKVINQTYNGNGYTMPLDYYVFDSDSLNAQLGVSNIPNVIDFFSTVFGEYPFKNEKYGMTQLGYYGGIENQTNSIVNGMSIGFFDWLLVHELAHQWFADKITCSSWNHGWLNEGFSSYAEALYKEHSEGATAYHDYMSGFEFKNDGTLYRYDVSNPFTVFEPIIYNKGAYVLHMLRGVLGDTVFFNAIHTYSTNPVFEYKFATTQDFQEVCETASGRDLDFFFSQWVYDEYYPMYQYNFKNDLNNTFKFTIQQKQGLLGRRDVFEMPLSVRLVFTDGSDSLLTINNSFIQQDYEFTTSKNVDSVFIDPDNWVLKTVSYNPNITVGVTELDNNYMTVFPNPSNGQFRINFSSISLKDEKEIKVFGLNGQLLHQLNGQFGESVHLDLSHLSEGVYFLKGISDATSFSERIIILK
jgi:aminopeptidase N